MVDDLPPSSRYSMKHSLIFFLTTIALSNAESILWKATGSITSTSGAFIDDSLPNAADVTIRMTYDDLAVQDTITETFGRVDSDYRDGIELKIEITIGDLVWEGFVQTGTEGTPYTFFTKIKDPFPTPESIDAAVSESDGGSFATFPFGLAGGSNSIALKFTGTNSQFLDGGISAGDINTEHLASASGTIKTGGDGNELKFSINPATVEVLKESDEVLPPTAPRVEISSAGDNVTLSWESEFRFRYRVESTSDLSTAEWDEVETRNGTGTPISRTYPVVDDLRFYRVVTIEREPVE